MGLRNSVTSYPSPNPRHDMLVYFTLPWNIDLTRTHAFTFFLFVMLSVLGMEVDELKGLRRNMLVGLTKDMQTDVTKVNRWGK